MSQVFERTSFFRSVPLTQQRKQHKQNFLTPPFFLEREVKILISLFDIQPHKVETIFQQRCWIPFPNSLSSLCLHSISQQLYGMLHGRFTTLPHFIPLLLVREGEQ